MTAYQWVIESGSPALPEFWTGSGWSPDRAMALRFDTTRETRIELSEMARTDRRPDERLAQYGFDD